MVQRYARQVGDAGLPRARLSDARAPNAGAVGAAVGGLGDMLGAWDAALAARAEKKAEADATAAKNAYQKALTAYLYNPDTGVYSQRKLGLAENATADFDTFADKARDEMGTGLSPRARALFGAMSEDVRMPFWTKTSVFEADETEKYETQTYQAAIDGAAETVALDPMNGALFESQLDQLVVAVGQQNRGASETVLRQKFGEEASKLETARIKAVMRDDPVAAQGMIESSPYLGQEDRGKLLAENEGDFELIRNQGIIDGILAEHGMKDEYAIRQQIVQNFEGDQERALLTILADRFNAFDAEVNRRERAVRERQEETYNGYLFRITQGDLPSDGEMRKSVANGDMTPGHYESLQSKKQDAADLGSAQRRIRAENPNLTPEEVQQAAIFQVTGRRPEDTAAAFRMLTTLAKEGKVTEGQIDDYRASGWLLSADAEKLKETLRRAKSDSDGTASFKEQKSRLSGAISKYLKSAGISDMGKAYILDGFTERVEALPPDLSPQERRKETERIRIDIEQEVLSEIETKGGKAYNRELAEQHDRLREIRRELEAPEEAPPGPALNPAQLKVSAGMKAVVSAHGGLVASAAAEHGVPVSVVYGIIQTESGGNARAKSGAGAMGLMQLMPGTAQGLGVKDAYDPAQNVRGGVRYFAQMLKKYGGNVERALQAYNWGPGNMDAWLMGKKRAMPKETQAYAAKVMRSAKLYDVKGAFAPPRERASLGEIMGIPLDPAM